MKICEWTGEDLKCWRKQMRWSQREAAERLGLCENSIGNYERGHRTDGRNSPVPLLLKLACEGLSR